MNYLQSLFITVLLGSVALTASVILYEILHIAYLVQVSK